MNNQILSTQFKIGIDLGLSLFMGQATECDKHVRTGRCLVKT